MSSFLHAKYDANRDQVPVPDGSTGLFTNSLDVLVSRIVDKQDFDRILKCASGITITIPLDSVLSVVDPNYAPTLNFCQRGAAAPTIVTTGLTMLGTQKTFAQNVTVSAWHSGTNEWTWI